MAGKRTTNQRYAIHGQDVDSLRRGFVELGMPEHRQEPALEMVRDVLAVNSAKEFFWYMPPVTIEICCYWDGANRNLLWITSAVVQILNDPEVARPSRVVDYRKADGDTVGWLLPGSEGGGGGGPKKSKIKQVRCPEYFTLQPAGARCPDCDVVHS